MKKKIVSVITVALAVILCASMFAGCKKKESAPEDSYIGSLGKTEYTSEDEATEGFVLTEFGGIAEIVEYKKDGKLSESDIKALGLSDTEAENIDTVTQITVTYKYAGDESDDEDDGIDTQSLIDDIGGFEALAGRTFNSKVYLLKYKNGKYKYFTPAPKTGELITKSYLDSILYVDKYLNCTVKVKGYNAYDVHEIRTNNCVLYEHTEDAKHKSIHDLYFVKTNDGIYEIRINILEDRISTEIEKCENLFDYDEEMNEIFFEIKGIDDVIKFEFSHYRQWLIGGFKTETGLTFIDYDMSKYNCIVNNGRLKSVSVVEVDSGEEKEIYKIEFSDFGTTPDITLSEEAQKLLDDNGLTLVK